MVQHTTYDRAAIRKDLEHTFRKATDVISLFPAAQVHFQPSPGVWSAANVADHLTKSNVSIAKALLLPGSAINRDAAERVPELESIFLDYTKKFESPAFILPGSAALSKREVLASFRDSCQEILRLCEQVDLSEMINHRAFGDITKYEILHFVKFHTMRHTVQIENLLSLINKNDN